MPDLSGLREGDEIAIRSRYGTSIRRVVKVYKRYIVDDAKERWRLDDGGKTTRGPAWEYSWAEPATDVHRTLIENYKTRAACRLLLDDLAPRAVRDTNLAVRILEALMPVLNDDDVDADHG